MLRQTRKDQYLLRLRLETRRLAMNLITGAIEYPSYRTWGATSLWSLQ